MRLTTLKALECLVDRMHHLCAIKKISGAEQNEFDFGTVTTTEDIYGNVEAIKEESQIPGPYIKFELRWGTGNNRNSFEHYIYIPTRHNNRLDIIETMGKFTMSDMYISTLRTIRGLASSFLPSNFRYIPEESQREKPLEFNQDEVTQNDESNDTKMLIYVEVAKYGNATIAENIKLGTVTEVEKIRGSVREIDNENDMKQSCMVCNMTFTKRSPPTSFRQKIFIPMKSDELIENKMRLEKLEKSELLLRTLRRPFGLGDDYLISEFAVNENLKAGTEPQDRTLCFYVERLK
jgi:hypothetical protein